MALITGTSDNDTIKGPNELNLNYNSDRETPEIGTGGLIGLGGDDLIRGGSTGDYISGGSGNDTIFGGQGDDEHGSSSIFSVFLYYRYYGGLYGGGGKDKIYGGSGSDLLEGGPGNDLLDGGSGDDAEYDDTLYASYNGLFGGAGADRLYGRAGRDLLKGGPGSDVLFGGEDDDQSEISYEAGLFGEDGNDKLYGGRGNDFLDGGKGRDLLSGGGGEDTFSFSSRTSGITTSTADEVIDWQAQHDSINSEITGTSANYREDSTFARSIWAAATLAEKQFTSSSISHVFLYNRDTDTGFFLSDLNDDNRFETGVILKGAGASASFGFVDII